VGEYFSVLRIKIWDSLTSWPLDPESGIQDGLKNRIRIRDEQPGPYFWDPGLKYLNSLLRIWGWKNSDLVSGINIPDPQHWFTKLTLVASLNCSGVFFSFDFGTVLLKQHNIIARPWFCFFSSNLAWIEKLFSEFEGVTLYNWWFVVNLMLCVRDIPSNEVTDRGWGSGLFTFSFVREVEHDLADLFGWRRIYSRERWAVA
jgi:hypothetical protein